jgi:flagellar biosynthetic protein FliQ
MQPQDAVDLGREALWFALQLGGPILLVILGVSLVIGFLQSMTQIQDSAISAIPRIVIVLIVLALGLPWLGSRLVEYTADHWQRPINLNSQVHLNPPLSQAGSGPGAK